MIVVWPHVHTDWASVLDRIEATYLELCRHIGRHQDIIMVALDDGHVLHIRQRLDAASVNDQNIRFLPIATNDTWVRDYGPVCTRLGDSKALLDFEFNGWGLQQYRYSLDNAFNAQLIGHLNFKASYRAVDQVFEAGNIEINGNGELLCSKSCFRRGNCASTVDFSRLGKQIRLWLGCSEIYWVDDVRLAGDDTCGHIDTLARFCANEVIAHTVSGNRNDPNHETTARLAMQLKAIRQQSGNSIELVPLPLPDPVFMSGQQLPATYTHFLIANNIVLVPVFHDKQDSHVLKLVDELFPEREIIDIESNTLIQQYGGLHCAAMQIPEGFLT